MSPSVDPKISEDQLLRSVIDLAHWRGWRVHHCRPALTAKGRWLTPIQGDRGFCDLVLLRPPRLLIVELKAETGSPDGDQKLWLAAFAAASVETALWRPRHWLDGTIDRALA